MNVKEWRTRAADEVNWNLLDVDARFLAELLRDQNTILDTIHESAPGAFVPDTETVFLYKDFNGTSLNTTLSVVSTDDRVMSLGVLAAGVIPTDGTYDGLFHLEAKDPDGKWHRRQVREFFVDLVTSATRFTIDRPWRNTTDTGMVFRLYQPYVVLRSDVTQVLDAQVYDDSRTLITTLPEGWAHAMDRNDHRGREKGRPEKMYRGKHFQIEAPNRAPTAALASGDPTPAWVGEEPPGEFEYCYTYGWGKRDREIIARGGVTLPTFESSPSPISAAVTAPGDGSRAIDITLPEIDWMLGYNATGSARATHSGYRVLIYRRRKSVLGSLYRQKIEYANVFHFLDEVDGSAGTYRDTGEKIPDYHRRLPESHGYYLWRMVPYQDNEYQLDIRVRRKPMPLMNDYDAPRIDPSANEMLVQALMSKLYRKKGNYVEADKAWAKFEQMCARYQGRFANPATIVPGAMRDTNTLPDRTWGNRVNLAPYTER